MIRKLFVLLTFITSLSASVAAWMSDLPDFRRLRQMSIPGSHDAATSSVIGLYGKCQDLTISQQWDKGVRAFDLRPRVESNNLMIYHGSVSTNVSLESAFNDIKTALTSQPGETAVIIIHKEKDSSDWNDKMYSFIDGYTDVMVPWSTDITLGDARGKMIVITRDDFSHPMVAFADRFGDNQAYKDAYISLGDNGCTLWLQDNYEFESFETKADAVKKMLDYSCGNHSDRSWVLNHTSGYKKTLAASNSDIKDNANATNKVALDYLSDTANPKGRTGMLMMDYAGADSNYGQELVNQIIARNSETPVATTNDAVSYFHNSDNWVAGAQGKGACWLRDNNIVESYSEDSFKTGTIISSVFEGLENGRYLISLTAHANWTPGRGVITTAHSEPDAKGHAQLELNSTTIDLPVVHSTGFPEMLHTYIVPVEVTDETLSIAFNNVRSGANWFQIYVHSIDRIDGEVTTAFVQDFEANYIGIETATGASNRARVGDGNQLSGNFSYENWNGERYTGNIFSHLHVPDGRYRVSLDVRLDVNDDNSVFFYANNERTPIVGSDLQHPTLTTEVTDGILEFGVTFENPVSWWTRIDNLKVELLSDMDDSHLFAHSDPVGYFRKAGSWVHSSNCTQPSGYKDDTFVENWQPADRRPVGNIITATHKNIPDGSYLVGIYAFSCFTGAEAPEEDAAVGYATLRVNDSEVALPTFKTGDVPRPHDLYYVPADVTDGTLTIAIDANGFPNWFMVDVLSIIPFISDRDIALSLNKVRPYGHDRGLFSPQMTAEVSNQVLSSHDDISPDDPFFESRFDQPYTGRIFSRVYLPEGLYTLGLDCFAENISSNLNDYYFFANDEKSTKTQANSFETLSATVQLKSTAKKVVSRASVGLQNLLPLEYGLGIDQPASQWVAVKNPTITLKANVPTGVEEITTDRDDSTFSLDDDRVFNIYGIQVATGVDALNTLPSGIYIINGKKYLVR